MTQVSFGLRVDELENTLTENSFSNRIDYMGTQHTVNTDTKFGDYKLSCAHICFIAAIPLIIRECTVIEYHSVTLQCLSSMYAYARR